jgi:uncharacterized protein
MLFAPITAQLQATATLVVTQALNTWLGNQITVQDVSVITPASTAGAPPGTVTISISYVLIETQSVQQTQISVG